MGTMCSYNTSVCKAKSESKSEIITNATANIVDQIQRDFIVTSENENIVDQLYGLISILEPKQVHYVAFTPLIKEALQGFRLAHKLMRFHDKDDYKRSLQMYENRFYGLNHPNMLIIHAMQNQKVDEFFGTDYVISMYLDYPTRTFQRELIFRQRSWFSEQEILYFLDSLVGALAFLQSKGLAHQNLSFEAIYVVTLMNGTSCIKINDPLMCREGLSTFERHQQLQKQQQDVDITCYFSPEQLGALARQDEKQQFNEFKSDVFSLGMLVLELCTLTKCLLVYDAKKLTINEELLQDLLLKVAERYSDGLYELIKIMVYMNVKKRYHITHSNAYRPDFFELDELISSSFQELLNKRIGQTWQYCDYQYCIQEGLPTTQSLVMLRKSTQPLVHPDLYQTNKAKPLLVKRASQRQLSSIRQTNEAGMQQSNLSIFEASSPQLSRKEIYGAQTSSNQLNQDSLLQSYFQAIT